MIQKMSCLAFISFAATSLMASVLSLTLVAVDRCLSISCPLAYKSHSIQRRTRFAILGAWLCALMYGLVPCVFNRYSINKKCLMMLQAEDWYFRYLTTGLLTAGIVVSLLCYCKIGYVFLDHQRNITVIQCTSQSTRSARPTPRGRRLIQIRVKSQTEVMSTAFACDIQMFDVAKKFSHKSSKSKIARHDKTEPDKRLSESDSYHRHYLERNKIKSSNKSNPGSRTSGIYGDHYIKTKDNALFCCSAAYEDKCMGSQSFQSNYLNIPHISEDLIETSLVQSEETSSKEYTAVPSVICRRAENVHKNTCDCVREHVIGGNEAGRQPRAFVSHSAAVDCEDELMTDDTVNSGNVSQDVQNIQSQEAALKSEAHGDLSKRRSSGSQQSLQIVLLEPSIARNTLAKDMSRNSRCLIKMVFLTQMVFTACMLPSVIIFVLYGRVEIPGWLMNWFPLVAFFNSAVNVFIYAGYNVKYRAAIGSVLRCRC
ncbi:hypothetical protein Btru_025454 [Bulinus truncatus]|nr:hypothetical protein Btru_025454 [Bulinus truncatus]